ncbi:NADPH2:quinone reductase [Mesorhizobium sp. J18]|uniref:NADPH:quinone reductase n=1 Tax=Mesorhizobium sp. J18 TaxID=935263 RepID=UPI0011995E8A|nr:NADPH:quinone reductase [Mesorhizobium sp. J18]TWH00601.1 NADPH2:quinone reductase [Mesorhizobium sp. J18]
MKAAWYERNGPARDVFKVGEMEAFEPAEGEVRVRLHASGVNPSDVKSRAGRPLIAPRIIPHSDGAGVIEATGSGVSHSRIGERVWIWNGQWKRPFGTAAEFITLPESQAIRLPDKLNFGEGACLGIPALTAMHAVRLHGDVGGKTLLITGGGSAVGHYATQIAKARGARIMATASGKRAEHARQAGADFVINYKAKDVARTIRDLTNGKGVDGIIDMDLSSTASLLPEGVLTSHGKMACYGSNFAGDINISFPAMLWNSLTLQVFVVYELTWAERDAAIKDLTPMLEAGSLKHSIGARFPLADIAAAHEAVEEGRTVGNIVLDIA